MPFIELKQSSGFIRIKSSGKITISMSLSNFFKDGHVKIFHDSKNYKIGFQPTSEGYKINNNNRCLNLTCHFLSRITQGEFYPIWSEKYQMLIVSYKP